MTFPKDIADHHKQNLTQKCHYMVSQFKGKNDELYNKYKERLATLKPEESWDFFHEMLVEYQKLGSSPAQPKKVEAPSKKEAPKAPAKKEEKTVAKKAPAKKAPAKKAAKKVAKKAPAKKVAAKKVAKKAPAKKVAKKAAKKTPAKKVAKKAKKK